MGFSLNLAGPFFAVYMLTRLGLPLPVVIGFTAISQITNILFVRVWGALADRAGSKTVLSLSASLFLLVIIGWVFTNNPGRYFLTLPLLGVLHVFADVVAADVTLTVDTMTLKSAPAGKATPYLGIAGIATGLGGGLGPIVGGLLADFFSVRTFRLDLSWASPNGVVELPALTLSGFDFLFAFTFVLGLLSLNLLAALREQGAMPRDVALSQLTGGMDPIMRVVSSVPGVNAVSAVSYGYLKRLPGADVALGVMAYQLASSTQATVASVDRGRVLATDVERRVANALEETIGETEDVAGHGLELARHATRGAIHIGDDLAEQMGRVARGAVLGTLRTLGGNRFSPLDSLRGAGYRAVQGAVESGQDSATAAAAAIGAAREAAQELGVSSHEAAAAMAEGVVTAAEAAGEETLRAVRDSLPVELAQAECFDTLVEDSQQ